VLPGQMNLPSDFSNDPVTDIQMGITKAEKNMLIPSIIEAKEIIKITSDVYIRFMRYVL
jgi:hypothetical protein